MKGCITYKEEKEGEGNDKETDNEDSDNSLLDFDIAKVMVIRRLVHS